MTTLETIAPPKVKDRKMLIDGKWVDSVSGKTFETINPSTGDTICRVAEGDKADVDLAVKAARKALESKGWRNMAPAQRGRLLNKLADLIEANAKELAALETLQHRLGRAHDLWASTVVKELQVVLADHSTIHDADAIGPAILGLHRLHHGLHRLGVVGVSVEDFVAQGKAVPPSADRNPVADGDECSYARPEPVRRATLKGSSNDRPVATPTRDPR